MVQWVGGGATESDLFADPNRPKGYIPYDDSKGGIGQTANNTAYEWGGKEGAAAQQTVDFRNKALGWRDHANQWDMATRGQQLALANQLQGPNQPTAALAAQQQAKDQAMRAALGQATTGGVNAAVAGALQPGMANAANTGAGTAQQEGQARDQLYSGILGQGRQQDIEEVGFDAKQNAEMEQFYQKMGFNVAQAQMLAQIARAKQNVQNWQRYNANELARQDKEYGRQLTASQLARQDLSNTMQSAGTSLGILARAGGS